MICALIVGYVVFLVVLAVGAYLVFVALLWKRILKNRREQRLLAQAKQSEESAALSEAARRERQRGVNLGYGTDS